MHVYYFVKFRIIYSILYYITYILNQYLILSYVKNTTILFYNNFYL